MRSLAKLAIAGLICITTLCGAAISPISHAFAASGYNTDGCRTETVQAVTRQDNGAIDPSVHDQITVRICPRSIVPYITGTWRGWTDLNPGCGYGTGAEGNMDTTSSGAGTIAFYYYNIAGHYHTDYINLSWGGPTDAVAVDSGQWYKDYKRIDYYATGGVDKYWGNCP